MLDIAIGMGRTTRPLLAQATHYVGIDFSEVMVYAARKIFPAADIRVMDMRDVPRAFAGQRFDAILISYNGLDYISWEDRCTLLLALRTLLAPEGVLVFSTHDLADKQRQSGFYLRPDLAQTWKMAYRPRSFLRLLLRLPRWLFKAGRNRRRNRRLEEAFDGYAYLNDSGEDYGLLTVYVSTPRQLDLLGASAIRRSKFTSRGCAPSKTASTTSFAGSERARLAGRGRPSYRRNPHPRRAASVSGADRATGSARRCFGGPRVQ